MFSRFFIYRPIFASVIAIVIVLVGVMSIPLLPIESMPVITPPSVQVSTSYPGAGAAVVAESVTAPMEEKINGVENMIYMSSKSASDGSCNITITFEVGTDVDMATVLVQNRVNEALPILPEEVTRQGVKVEKQSTNITLMINMVSPDGTFDELYISNYTTTRIKDVLARVNGISKVQIMGAKDFGMRIWIDPLLLRARGLTTLDLLDALREQNVQVAAGQIGGQPAPKDQPFEYSISTLGRLETVTQFENIIVKRGEAGQLVRIRDVARVELGAQSYMWYAKLDGAPSIAVAVYPAPGANALEVAEGVKTEMERLGAAFPEGLEYRILYDTTEYILQSLKEVVTTLIIAILLVILTVYIFLQDIRTTLVPAITIPVSLLGTFAVMLALGLSINGLTMFGLILVIGIVVDDAIVVVENTMRIIDEEGLSAKEATAKSMLEISGPVVATTLVLLGGLCPDHRHARDHRQALPALRNHHLGRHHLLIDQCPDPEPGALRDAAATVGGADQGPFRDLQPDTPHRHRGLYAHRHDVAPENRLYFAARRWAHGRRLLRHDFHALGFCPLRGRGLFHGRGPVARRHLTRPHRTGARPGRCASSTTPPGFVGSSPSAATRCSTRWSPPTPARSGSSSTTGMNDRPRRPRSRPSSIPSTSVSPRSRAGSSSPPGRRRSRASAPPAASRWSSRMSVVPVSSFSSRSPPISSSRAEPTRCWST